MSQYNEESLNEINNDDNNNLNIEKSAENEKLLNEMYLIDDTIQILQNEFEKYNLVCVNLWQNAIAPFLTSSNCVILTKINDKYDHYKFNKFMMTTKVYKELYSKRILLLNRKKQIQKQLERKSISKKMLLIL